MGDLLRSLVLGSQKQTIMCPLGWVVTVLALFEGGGPLGSRPKPSGKAFASWSKPRTRVPKEPTSLGSRDPQPKSKKTLRFSLAQVSSALARDPKGKAPMVFTVNRPKFAFKDKVVSSPCTKASFGLGSGVGQPADPGASTSAIKAFSRA
jgi:hypothetical protein